MPQTSPAVTLDHVSVTYRAGGVTALDDVSCVLSPGVTALLGRNGSGKTTLMRVAATLFRDFIGNAMVLGADPRRRGLLAEVRGRIGYLPQSFSFTPSVTVEDFLGYAAWLKKVPGARADAAVEEAIEFAQLGRYRRAKLGALSGGTLRRAGVAQAMVNDPELLILDEPAAGLDVEQRLNLLALITELGSSRTVLYSTHMIEEVAAISQQLVLLIEGRVAFVGESGELERLGAGDPETPGATALERGYVRLHERAGRASHE